MESSFTTTVEGRKEAIIVMELCSGGSLLDILNKRLSEHRPFTETEVLTIFLQVCEAVAHMHGCVPPIAHRDIKLENVLRGDHCFKLCDFGSATAIAVRPLTEIDVTKPNKTKQNTENNNKQNKHTFYYIMLHFFFCCLYRDKL